MQISYLLALSLLRIKSARQFGLGNCPLATVREEKADICHLQSVAAWWPLGKPLSFRHCRKRQEAVVAPEQIGPTTAATLSEISLVAALVPISGLHWSSWAITSTASPNMPPLALMSSTTIFDRVEAWHTIGGQIARMRALHAKFHFSAARGRLRKQQPKRHDSTQVRACFHSFTP